MKRQRADGTWTFTTVEWDLKWYWPVGTRVRVGNRWNGIVTKQNSVTVHVALDEGSIRQGVSVTVLERL